MKRQTLIYFVQNWAVQISMLIATIIICSACWKPKPIQPIRLYPAPKPLEVDSILGMSPGEFAEEHAK